MGPYVIRRLLLVVPLLLGITLITFTIINLAPGDPITALIDPNEMNVRTPEEMQALREGLGLNKPLPVRYVLWVKEVARGNLGFSIQNKRPVSDLILARLPASMALSVTSIVIAMIVGVALGVFSAIRQYSVLDYILTVLAFFGLGSVFVTLGFLAAACGIVSWRYLPKSM